MPEIEKNFRRNLSKYLNETGTTQIELAKYLNVSNSTISNYIQGLNMPRMNKIDKICDFFKITRSDLLESDEQKKAIENEKLLLLARDINNLTEEQQRIIFSMIDQFKDK